MTLVHRSPEGAGRMAGRPPCHPDALGIAEELAPMVRVWHRLIIDHTPDSEGRCRGCPEGAQVCRRHPGRVPSAGWPRSPGNAIQPAVTHDGLADRPPQQRLQHGGSSVASIRLRPPPAPQQAELNVFAGPQQSGQTTGELRGQWGSDVTSQPPATSVQLRPVPGFHPQ